MIGLIQKCLNWRLTLLAIAVFAIVWNAPLGPVLAGENQFFESSEPQDAAYALKRTVQITPRRYLRWWQNPSAAEPVYNTWSWARR